MTRLYKTPKSSIFLAEFITVGRVAVSLSPVRNVVDTWSSSSIFSSAKVAALRVAWSFP